MCPAACLLDLKSYHLPQNHSPDTQASFFFPHSTQTSSCGLFPLPGIYFPYSFPCCPTSSPVSVQISPPQRGFPKAHDLFTPLIVQSIFLLCHLQSNCLEPSSSFICLFPVNGYSLEYKTLRAKIISVLSHPSNPRWHPAHSRCSLITGAWMKDWVKNLSVMSSVGSKCEL